MKLFSRLLDALIIFIIGLNCVEAGRRETDLSSVPNNVIIERIEHQILNKTFFKDTSIRWRKTANNVIAFNATIGLPQPVNKFWMHAVLNYKVKEYQKYLLDVWLEICEVFETPTKHPLGPIILQNYHSFRDDVAYNFDTHCPLLGNLELKSLRPFNCSRIILPLLQAGRYRVDLEFSPKQNGPTYAAVQIYGSISDFRIWF